MKCSIYVKNRKCKLKPVYHNLLTKESLCRIHLKNSDSDFVLVEYNIIDDDEWSLINI